MKLKELIKPLVGKPNFSRELALQKILEKLKISYHVNKYYNEHEEHHNYLFSLGNTRQPILLTSHFDVYPGCSGANDNASGIAVLLGLYQKLRLRKIKQEIVFGVFDQEEFGCAGSNAYAKNNFNFKAVISLEMVGYGDVVGLWPITQEIRKQPVFQQFISSTKGPFEIAGELPIFYSDFTPFRQKGIKDSFCITMIPKSEIKVIRRIIKKPDLLKKHILLGKELPTFFRYYHSPEDTLEIINEKALTKVVNILYKMINRIEDKIKKTKL